MGASEDHVAFMGDRPPLSSTIFSSMRNDDIASRSVTGFDSANRRGTHSPDQNGSIQSSVGFCNEASNSNPLAGPRSSSRGGLVERMAARAGFNAPSLNMESIRPPELYTNPDVRSPYLTIPAGLSPTTLLESPVFLSNSMAFPSPTTGKFPFFPSGDSRDSASTTGNRDKEGKDNTFEDTNASSYAFRDVAESQITHFNATNSSFHSVEDYFHSEQQSTYPSKVNYENNAVFHQTNFCKSNAEDNGGGNLLPDDQTYYSVGVVDNSPPFEDNSPPFEEQHQQNEDGNQRVCDQDPNNCGGSGEDGYNWRKYGQKHVKGSEYPRSYFKCTHQNCPVKKKVERSHEGHITEIIYKGAHNHPKPPPNRRSVLGPTSALGDMQLDSEQLGLGAANDLFWSVMQKGNNLEYSNGGATNLLVAQSGTLNEMGVGVKESKHFSNNDDNNRATHGSVSLGYDGEGDESESKRRRTETSTPDVIGATRALREPRVVVQTKSEVDILDDGYRWRKYGQKVVKGNPNPRSYYKCTSTGCNVRKHVERASHDLKSVITTYEGKHNHNVPAARNSNSVSRSNTQQASISMNHVHRPKPSPVRGRSAWLERPQPTSFGLPGQHQVGSGYGFGTNQPGPSVLGLAGFGTHHGNLPTFPVHTYAGIQARPVNEMAYMLPKEELKSEPVMDSGLSSVVRSSVYYQHLMSQMPLGPQM